MGARTPSPTPGLPIQGSSVRRTSPHNFWLQKPAGIESVEENSGVPTGGTQAVPLKEPIHGLIYSDSLPLSFSAGVAA